MLSRLHKLESLYVCILYLYRYDKKIRCTLRYMRVILNYIIMFYLIPSIDLIKLT